ncbi:hypothetical protein MHK_000673 [Candidatus Magnetomorum sp. HK-1]|nr:hypothetical protein MHK_000673 [Candidatus Magnetomorum sp. HK-1]
MKIYLKEKIGDPNLFTGRKKELTSLLNWIEKIKFERSKSRALISRRKTGKSALMQRLFNITFDKNDGVIPFYFEIRETDQWIASFSKEFFYTFIYQYIAFKSRNTDYFLHINDGYEKTVKAAKKEHLNYLISHIESFEYYEKKGHFEELWDIARDAPRLIAQYNDERVVQMIDEFQFINRFIFWDKEKQRRANNLAGSYLHTAEYKNAPLLVSGSWIGWLMDILTKMLPARFIIIDFGDMPRQEAIEMAFNYSEIEQVPVIYETACIMADLTEGNPFYISSLFQSDYPDKDFSTEEGILKTLDFETFHKRGSIRGTWMEYILTAIDRINDKNGKKIVLYLCKHKGKEVTRDDIQKDLGLTITDGELEKRLKALVKSDIICQGTTNFDYQAVQDNIFDKVFRSVYQKEIDGFDPHTLKNEYRLLYKKLKGEYNKYKGEFSEYVIINHLKYRAYKNSKDFKSMINNLPEDFKFVEYLSVWPYTASPTHKKSIQVDILAHAKDSDYSIIGEVKNRQKKFSLKEAKDFLDKAACLRELEKLKKSIVFVFSSSGFFKNTIQYFKDNGVAWSEDNRFLKN